MTKKKKEYRLDLKAILGMYGVPARLKDEFLDRFLEAIEYQQADQILGYAKQLATDAFLMVMRERGHGPAKCRELKAEFIERLNQFDILAETEALDNIKNNNVEDDGTTDIIYTKYKIDEAVKPLYGAEFLEYDKRYSKAQRDERQHTWADIKKMAQE